MLLAFFQNEKVWINDFYLRSIYPLKG